MFFDGEIELFKTIYPVKAALDTVKNGLPKIREAISVADDATKRIFLDSPSEVCSLSGRALIMRTDSSSLLVASSLH